MYTRELHWRDLIPGAVTLLALLLIAFVILTQVGVGNLPGKKFTIYALAEQARGILKGSDVWLAGQRVGTIAEITFRPPASDVGERILMQIDVLEKHREHIRKDSRAQVRKGTRLIGNPVLHVTIGSSDAAIIEPGDTIATLEQFDAEAVLTRAEGAINMVPVLMSDLKSLSVEASRVERTLTGFLGMGARGAAAAQPSVTSLLNALNDLERRFASGSLGLLAKDTVIVAQLGLLRARADSLGMIYDPARSAAGRFIRDSALFSRVDSVATDLILTMNAIATRIEDYTTGARAQALREEIDRLAATMRALRTDAKRHPFKYIVF